MGRMLAKKVLTRLVVAVGIWAGLVAICFIFPSALGYAGLGLLNLWYIHIPALFGVVSVIWFVAQRVRRQLGNSN